jgi:hypothetical protein
MIAALLQIHRITAQALIDHKLKAYPCGTVILMKDGMHGIVTACDGCPPDKLAIIFESGNVWYKPLEVVVAIVKDNFPRWVRDMGTGIAPTT